MRFGVLVGFLMSLVHLSQAQSVQYYTFLESREAPRTRPAQFVKPSFDSPERLLVSFYQNPQRVALTLLEWIGQDRVLPAPQERYSRRQHYGTWIRGFRDGKCYNTRARVLMRDSVGSIKFRENNRCVVDSGSWYDQFSGQWVHRASELQIDHVVPVKVSYELGGFQWSRQKRCMFFNYLEAPEHLIPIGNSENAKKGARSPDLYLPQNKSFWCSYLQKWLRVKMVWNLPLLPEEADGIQMAIKERQCQHQDFQITSSELMRHRRIIFDQSHYCSRIGSQSPPLPSEEDDNWDHF